MIKSSVAPSRLFLSLPPLPTYIGWLVFVMPAIHTPLSLAQVAALFDEPALVSALEALDKALYSDTASAWDGTTLAKCLRQVRSRGGANKASGEHEFQLYPQGA